MDPKSINDAYFRRKFVWLFWLVIFPTMGVVFEKSSKDHIEDSWQNISLFVSLYCLLLLGSRRHVRKWRMGLKTVFALLTYMALICLFMTWKFQDNRQGIAAYLMLALLAYYGADLWTLWISRHGDWGAWRLGDSYMRKLYNRERRRVRDAKRPAESRASDSTPLPFRFTLPDSRTIRGESWQGTVVAEFSKERTTVFWPTESKWRRVAPAWAVPRWQTTLDQLTIWCEAEDAKLQVEDSASIAFE